MKARIKFAKYGNMKFIGHLDIMRFFQKALRRAGIDVKFSEGMSPHMIMSFASPLGLGLTSCGEYLDVSLNTPITTAAAMEALNKEMPEGMEILDFREILEEGKAGKAMALVCAADYEVTFRDGYEPEEGWQKKLLSFVESKSIIYEKKTKSGSKEVDLKPMIFHFAIDGKTMIMNIASGSSANLRPEQIIDAFYKNHEMVLSDFALDIKRTEMYAADPAVPDKLISLADLGHVIV